MSKVLVTGAAGFIGSHLTEQLVKDGFSVRAFVRYNSKNDWGWLEHSPLRDQIEVVTGDIRDYDSVLDAMQGVDTVYHLAALIGIPYSYVSPQAYIRTNIDGTYNVLQAARSTNTRVVHTSTSEVYGTALFVPITEEHPLQGQSPYSATKIGADQIALSYYRSFEMPVTVVRPFNTYGPRQSARAVIPTIISQLMNGKTEIKLGSITPTRDFNYVADTVRGFMTAATCDASLGEVVNVGSNYEISIGDLVKLISDVVERPCEILSDDDRIRPEKSEVERLWACNAKAKSLMNWTPEYGDIDGLRRGIKETADWFSNPDNLKMYKHDLYNV